MLDKFIYTIILYITIIELYIDATRDREKDKDKDRDL